MILLVHKINESIGGNKLSKSDLLKEIEKFRMIQFEKEKATDLLTFLYLLANEYNEDILLENDDLDNVVSRVLKKFN